MKKLQLNFSNDYEGDIGCNVEIFQKIFGRFEEVMSDKINELVNTAKGIINLILVDDETIHQINHKYREKDKATDVISFAYMESTEINPHELNIGDIFISIDTAKIQAKDKEHSLDQELSVLFVHGLLHLLGFDHNTDEEEEEMESWAKRVLIF